MLSHLAHFCSLEHAIDDILGLFLPRRGHDLSSGGLLLLAFGPGSAKKYSCLVYGLVFCCCRQSTRGGKMAAACTSEGRKRRQNGLEGEEAGGLSRWWTALGCSQVPCNGTAVRLCVGGYRGNKVHACRAERHRLGIGH
jgi:hypothetical protein